MEENKDMKKTNNKLLILIIIAIGLILCVGSFFLGQSLANKEDETLNKEETKEEIKEKEEENEVQEEENKVTEEDDEKTVTVINFDRNKCINNDDFSNKEYEIGRFGISVDISGLSFNIDKSNEKKVLIQVRYDMMYSDEYVEENKIENEDVELIFDKEVEFIFSGLFSADHSEGLVIIFLLEDGSLEYMKYSDIYESRKYVHKPIEGVEGIVRFDNLAINYGPANTGYTTIAYKIDGTYYDLGEIIKVGRYN